EHDGYLWRASRRRGDKPAVHLLPPYDEYTVAYRDRAAILDPARAKQTRNGIFSPVIVVDGRVAGTWTREIRPQRVAVVVVGSRKRARKPLAAAVARYGAFHGRPGELRRVR